MQHRSRHIHAHGLATAAALVAACALTGCSVGPVSLDDFVGTPSVEEALADRRAALAPVVTSDALVEPDTLTVGLLATQTAPLVITADDGTPSGIDVDTALALADALGLSRVSFVSVPNVAGGLDGTCDVVMGVEDADAGDATVAGGYAQSATGLFTTGGVTAPIDAADLDGATVGVQAGSVSASLLDDYDLSITQSPYANLNDAFDALEAGEVDYVACDAYAGAYLAATLSDASFAGTLDDPVTAGVAVPSGELQAAVTSALQDIQTNGVGDVARARWVGALPTLTAETRVTGLTERPDEAPADDEATDDSTTTDAAAADAATTDAADATATDASAE
ncbi:substrate-binding periplasmic protein [Thermophilibacter sp.]